MKQLIEYRIETESSLKKVYLMWKKFFKDDTWWHFTLEGSYIEIRLSKKNRKLEEYLKNKKYNYTRFSYIDNIDTTRKYQEAYQFIFHGYSQIIMRILDENRGEKKKDIRIEEVRKTLERIIHLAYNLFGFDNWSECRAVAQYTIGRAHFAGYYQAMEEVRKGKNEKSKTTKKNS